MQKSLIDAKDASGVPDQKPAQVPAQPAAVPMEKSTHFKTEGEKKFDMQAYRFWGYYMNVALSLVAVWWVERTHSGQKFLNNWADRFERWGAKRERAEFLSRKSFFLVGGFAVIPPIKWLEDKKAELVKKYNREIYGAKADADPKITQSEQEVADAPKQSWKSVIVGRLLALVPFYITVGLLWDRTSLLGRMTNPHFKGKTLLEIKAWEKSNPVEFAQVASKGIYFDKPITWLSRRIGKLVAGITGQREVAASIAAAEKDLPGAMKTVKTGDHEPMHSVGPYYFISEAITSAMVAVGLYLITRVTGPFFDKKKDAAHVPSKERVPSKEEVSSVVPASELKRDDKVPQTKISLTGVERQMVVQSGAYAAVQ